MKQKVSLSGFSVMLSAMCLIVLALSMYHTRERSGVFYLLAAIIIIWILLSLFYMPFSVSVSDDGLKIHRAMRVKNIALSEIKSIKLCPPTMAERRLCGSGGFFGYWGWFSEPSVGKYFAYYGKASDCFLVELKNGRKYLIGCDNSNAMVDSIIERLHTFS